MFLICSEMEGLIAFFLNILWEWREMTHFKMSLILHCTSIKFPKTGFTVSHSALTFHVWFKVKYFSISMLVWPKNYCCLVVLWFVPPVIYYYKMFKTKKSVVSLLHEFQHYFNFCTDCWPTQLLLFGWYLCVYLWITLLLVSFLTSVALKNIK